MQLLALLFVGLVPPASALAASILRGRLSSTPVLLAEEASSASWPAWLPSTHHHVLIISNSTASNNFTKSDAHSSICGTLVMASLGNVHAQLGSVNDTYDSTAGVVSLVNDSALRLLEGVDAALTNGLSSVQMISTAAQAVHAFHVENSTAESVATFVTKVSQMIAAVQLTMEGVSQTSLEQISRSLEEFQAWRVRVLDQFSGSIAKVVRLCGATNVALLQRESLNGIGDWLQSHVLGNAQDEGAKCENAIRGANASASQLSGMLDSFNVSSNKLLGELLTTALAGATQINTSLPRMLDSFELLMPAPVLNIVRSRVLSVFEKVLTVLDDMLESTAADMERKISHQIQDIKARMLPVIYAATENLAAVAEEGRAAVAVAKVHPVNESNAKVDDVRLAATPAMLPPSTNDNMSSSLDALDRANSFEDAL